MINYYETKSQPITKVMVWQAYKMVKANRGSHGIDEMTWEKLDNNLRPELYKLWNRLSSGSYYPKPVKEVGIPKKDGGIRKLGIPTILDRIAQQVAKTDLERIVEPIFHKSSFGYRPQRNCHDAVGQANKNSFNHDFVIDLDIKGFFDTINHELLMKAVSHYCKKKWILVYIERWLKSGVMQRDGNFTPKIMGTPQGGVISPLLANIYLHIVFDGWMEVNYPSIKFERYADDVVVHCKTEKQAKFILNQIETRMKQCKLQLHPEKTRIVNLKGKAIDSFARSFDFLGFTIRQGSFKCTTGLIISIPGTFVSKKSKSSIHAKFKVMEIHKWRKPIEEISKILNPVIRGIINYYHKFESGSMSKVWNDLNCRLLKWVKWERGLYKRAALKWLRTKYKEQPNLFAHWLLVHP